MVTLGQKYFWHRAKILSTARLSHGAARSKFFRLGHGKYMRRYLSQFTEVVFFFCVVWSIGTTRFSMEPISDYNITRWFIKQFPSIMKFDFFCWYKTCQKVKYVHFIRINYRLFDFTTNIFRHPLPENTWIYLDIRCPWWIFCQKFRCTTFQDTL